MSKTNIILQQLQDNNTHNSLLKRMLSAEWVKEVYLSSAFANENGIKSIESELNTESKSVTAFIGIRNVITTAQSIATLNNLGVKVYGIDTASQSFIFHPKIYLALGEKKAELIVGSANLTWSGLHNNFEASVHLEMDLSNPIDKTNIDNTINAFEKLKNSYPDHCILLNEDATIKELLDNGLLADENEFKSKTISTTKNFNDKNNAKSAMNINLKRAPKKSKTFSEKEAIKSNRKDLSKVDTLVYGELLWQKDNLPKGDLQLLEKGHSSGVLRLVQAGFKINEDLISQTSYFKEVAFSTLDWIVDKKDPEKQITFSDFILVVVGVNVGTYNLKISYKPAWESGQGNYTTGLHWGDAVDYIRQEGLIGRTLYLYAPSLEGNAYTIVID